MMPRSDPASASRTCFCSCGGKKSMMRAIVSCAFVVCSVDMTKWPVSDADRAAFTVSTSRISPTRITSGSWRIAARSATAKSSVSSRTSRWLIIDSESRCRTSIGSSMVTMWHSRWVLMWSTMPASVVVLPEPVGPVTSTRPRGSRASWLMTAGTLSSSSGIAPTETRRNTRPTEPRERNALTRNRPTPAREYAKSASLVRLNDSRRSSRITSSAMAAVCSGVSAGPCSLRRRPSMRRRAGDPTLMCRSEPRSSASARRYGETEMTAGSSTSVGSAPRGVDLSRPGELLHPGDDPREGRDDARVVLVGQAEVDALERLALPGLRAAVADQVVVGVGRLDDPAGQRHRPVVGLVPAPVGLGLPLDDHGDVVQHARAPDDGGAQVGDPPLLPRRGHQRGTAGDRLGERELADVVQQGRVLEVTQRALGQTEVTPHGEGQRGDAPGVPGLGVAAELGDPRQRADGLVVRRLHRRVPTEGELGEQQGGQEDGQGRQARGGDGRGGEQPQGGDAQADRHAPAADGAGGPRRPAQLAPEPGLDPGVRGGGADDAGGGGVEAEGEDDRGQDDQGGQPPPVLHRRGG